MSWQPAKEPVATAEPTPDPVEIAIVPRTRDLGDGFEVRRVLPFAKRRMVGPFVFFDAMGPVVFEAGHGLDVRPHPHIGLATVTYLFERRDHPSRQPRQSCRRSGRATSTG